VKKLLTIEASDIDGIVLSHDDVFGPGDFVLEIRSSSGHKEFVIGRVDVLKAADFLREDLPEASKQIKALVENNGLFNNAQVIYSKTEGNW
jgi:hypothetical protein